MMLVEKEVAALYIFDAVEGGGKDGGGAGGGARERRAGGAFKLIN
jgi:hypothetical protein